MFRDLQADNAIDFVDSLHTDFEPRYPGDSIEYTTHAHTFVNSIDNFTCQNPCQCRSNAYTVIVYFWAEPSTQQTTQNIFVQNKQFIHEQKRAAQLLIVFITDEYIFSFVTLPGP